MPSDLDDELVVPPPPPGLREAVIGEGRRRMRARRMRAMSALAAVAALAGGGIVALAERDDAQRVRTAEAPEATTSPRPPASPPPEVLVVATTGATGVPGDIQLVSSVDGTVLRTLAHAYGPYPANGLTLSPDGRFAYFVRLLEAEQRFEIARAHVDGDVVEHVAFGTRQSFDPTGARMAYVSDRGGALVVRDMVSGAERSFDTDLLPSPALGERLGALRALTWLDDRRLAVLVSRPITRQRCAPIGGCPTTTTAVPTTPTSHVLIFNPAKEELEDAEVHPAPVGVTWGFLARGTGPNELVVAESPSALAGASPWNLVAIDVTRPGSRALGSLPLFAEPWSIDASGQHLLYQNSAPGQRGLFRLTLVDKSAPVALGHDDLLAASW